MQAHTKARYAKDSYEHDALLHITHYTLHYYPITHYSQLHTIHNYTLFTITHNYTLFTITHLARNGCIAYNEPKRNNRKRNNRTEPK